MFDNTHVSWHTCDELGINMTTKIIRALKRNITKSIVVEIRVYHIDNKKYPEDVKYSLVCIDKKSGRKVLFDNHHPKSHHFHIDNDEYVYKFTNVDKLMKDFEDKIKEHFNIKW